MSVISFGEFTPGRGYKTVDEHQMRTSAALLLVVGFIAFANGFILQNFIALPFISGFIALNFFIGVFINPRFAPTMAAAKILTRNKPPLPIGAVQKRFAWSLGLLLSSATFALSLLLLGDLGYFKPVCLLCLLCIAILYYESLFGVCVGCKLYHAALGLGVMKVPEEKPACMGESCSTTTRS